MTTYLSTKEAAEIAGVSPLTIIDWIHRNRLKASRNASARGRFKILPEDLQEAMTYRPAKTDG